jgi:GYF domain 2
MKIYLHNGNEQQGPFELGELDGKIKRDTLVWHEGLEGWLPAFKVPELNHIVSQIPPEIPTATSSSKIVQQPELSFPSIKKVEEKSKKSSKGNLLRYSIWGAIITLLVVLIVVYQNQVSIIKEKDEIQTSLNASQEQLNIIYQQTKREDSIRQVTVKKEAEKQRFFRVNWNKYLTAEVSSFKTLGLGGFEDILISVQNSTAYPVDALEVTVNYWKVNGGLYKSEVVVFTDLTSQETASKYAPSSDRGSRLEAFISKVTARKFEFCFDPENYIDTAAESVVNDDIWRCLK